MSEAVEQEIRTLRAHFWSERDPEGRAFAPLADAYRRKGDLDEAGSLVEDGLARLPEFTPGHLVAARIGRAQGDLEGARAALDRVLELDGQNVLALLERAELARDTGDPEGAMQDLRRLLELDPGHMGARAALDRLEAAGGEPAGREATTDEAPTEEAPTDEVLTEEAPGPSDSATTDEAGFGDLDLEPTALTDPVQEERERRVEEEVDEAFDEAFQPISGDLDVFDFELDEVEEEGSPGDAQVESAGLEIDPTELDLEPTDADLDPTDVDLEPTDADFEPTDADLEPTGLERAPVEPEPEVEQTDAEIESLEPSLPSDEAEIETEAVETRRTEAEAAAGEDEPDEEEDEDSSLMTRTMADLFAKQGLTEQAVGVYERLLERSPDDPEVRQRLSELRARLEEDRSDEGAAGVEAPDAEPAEVADSTEEPDLRDVAPQWAGDEPGDESEAVATPFAWEPEEGGEAPEEREAEPERRAAEAPKRSISDHFEDLLAWSPGAVPVEHLAPDAPTETAPPGSLAARGDVPEEPAAATEEPAAVSEGPAAGTEEPSAATEESPRDDAPTEPEDEDDDDMDDFRSWLKSLES